MINPLISIITVTYNAQDLLVKTIQSVINQSYKNIEYIIIDGGSSDATLDIIKKYEQSISYWNSEPDTGIYDAMNKGIEKANGLFINFMNAGDVFVSDDIINSIFSEDCTPFDIVYGDTILQINEQKIYEKAYDLDIFYSRVPFYHQSSFVRSKLLKEEKFDLTYKLSADYDFMLRSYVNNRKFKYIEKAISIFLHGGATTQNQFQSYYESTHIIYKITNNIDYIEQSVFMHLLASEYFLDKPNMYNASFLKLYSMITEKMFHIMNSYNRVVIYGNGFAGKILAKLLRDKLVVVIDATDTCSEYNVIRPDQFINYEYDCVVVSVLFREDSIIKSLTSKYNVDGNKIITLVSECGNIE